MLLTLYKSALRPLEIKALLKLKIGGNIYAPPKEPLQRLALQLDDKTFCYAALGKVSRSFSAVIQQLPEELKDAVCIFYLALRALDTIEDDMSLEMEKKKPLLLHFHRHIQEEGFSLPDVGDNADYRTLLENYPKVYRIFKELNAETRHTIIDIAGRMGYGMLEFSNKEILSVKDFDAYCHYVAGLVGIGLTRLFVAFDSGSVTMINRESLSNAMGLFLQKTNIIRDYYEDLFADRTFWPQEIWNVHVDNLEDLSKDPEGKKSLTCLNHMIADALRHIPDCLDYLNNVKDDKIFRFAAVPQIMAIATLAKLYNNPNVLRKNVKVRKGLAAKLMLYNITRKDLHRYFDKNILVIEKKNKPGMAYHNETKQLLRKIKKSVHYN
jgi:farnesyl-diphosphate farnesyltransferase